MSKCSEKEEEEGEELKCCGKAMMEEEKWLEILLPEIKITTTAGDSLGSDGSLSNNQYH